jgi:hypothetical protein
MECRRESRIQTETYALRAARHQETIWPEVSHTTLFAEVKEDLHVVAFTALQAVGDDQLAWPFVQAHPAPMDHWIGQAPIPIMPPLGCNKLIIVLNSLGLAACYVAPKKGSTSHRLILSVYTDSVMGGGASEICPPHNFGVVTEGTRIHQKLLASIAKPEAEGICVPMSVKRVQPKRSGIEDHYHFIVTTAIGGEHVVATLRERVQMLCGLWRRYERDHL